jgi:hypothetical protein
VVVNSLLECPHVPVKMTWTSNGTPGKNSYETMWVSTGAVGQVCSTETGGKKGVPGIVPPLVNFDDRQRWPLPFEGS